MKHFLDLKSLIDSDYYKNNNRLHWHVEHLEYDKFTKDLYTWLNSIELFADEKEIFDISSVFIYTELASYLTHVYDFVYLSKRNVSPIYSNQSNVFIDKIWNKEVVKTSLLIELEKNKFRVDKLKQLYSFLVKIFPKKYVQTLVVSSNDLVEQYLNGTKGITLKIIPHYYFEINIKSSTFSKKLSIKVRDILVQKIESNYFTLNNDHIESIGFILDSFIARAYNNMSSYNGFLSGCNKNVSIITGTGNNYYNRLLSSIGKKEDIEVIRFNHGGERCFYDDSHFWENGDLFQTNKYVTYGKKWKIWLEKIVINSENKITIKSIGSDYHKKIYNKFFNKKIQRNKKILYIPNSFIGEIRVFPFAKLIDPILFDWQKYLIEVLQKNGFEVIYKKHPKGFLHEENFLGELATYQSTKPMLEALEDADMVLCDMAGSAFTESLCAGKNIVLIDTLQRPFDFSSMEDLQGAVKIIDAYWEENTLKIDEKKLIDAFTNFDINKENIRKVVKDYFLSEE
jgi:hypothetical protein